MRDHLLLILKTKYPKRVVTYLAHCNSSCCLLMPKSTIEIYTNVHMWSNWCGGWGGCSFFSTLVMKKCTFSLIVKKRSHLQEFGVVWSKWKLIWPFQVFTLGFDL